jgi:hypothetical protein
MKRDEESPNNESPRDDHQPLDLQVDRLVVALASDDCSAADVNQLETLVCSDQSARQRYIRGMALLSSLQWGVAGGEADPGKLWLATTHRLDSATNPPSLRESDPLPKTADLPTFSNASRRSFGWPRVAASLIAAACLYGVFALLSWNLRPDQLPRGLSPFAQWAPSPNDGREKKGAAPLSSVAVVRDTTDVQWSQNAPSKLNESSILSGEPLKIESGTMEIELKAGTKLVVEGPADWTIDGENRATLRSGKLTARITPQAIGFTLDTPSARIVDLGTEFGVVVDDKRATDVIVFRGEVNVKSPAMFKGAANDPPPSVRLTTGQSSHVSPQGVVVRSDAPDVGKVFASSLFKNYLEQLNRKGFPMLVSQGKPVTVSSAGELGLGYLDGQAGEVFPPQNIVDGRLNDTGEPGNWSFWLAPGAVAAELVIDLTSIEQVAAICVHNTHNRLMNDRGSRHVRLSLSSDGKSFLPIGEIELPDAARQESIEMHEVALKPPSKARYVKVEITSWYGFGPGLNEVQVFAIPSRDR